MRHLAATAACLVTCAVGLAQNGDPTWAPLQALDRPNPHGLEVLSNDVVLEGTTVAVGTGDTHTVRIHERPGTKWVWTESFDGPVGFGTCLDLDAGRLAGGTQDGVRFYRRFPNGNWSSGETLALPAAVDDVGISGDTIAATSRDLAKLYVLRETAGVWALEQEIDGPADVDYGATVAIDGDTIVVGARDHPDPDGPGAALVYRRSGTTWSLETTLVASDGVTGDAFGWAVALEGETAVVGAPFDDQVGSIHVFRRTGSAWDGGEKVQAGVPETGDRFGAEVVLAGERIAVGLPRRDGPNGADAGVTYVLTDTGSEWEERVVLPVEGVSEKRFGETVGLDGALLAVGANFPSAGGSVFVSVLGDELGTVVCDPAVPNSTGVPGRMRVLGSSVVADDDLSLVATDLPWFWPPNLGYFVMGTGTNTFTPPGSAGPICIAPGLVRFLPSAHSTGDGPAGFFRFTGTTGPVSGVIVPGSTWGFQAWHRDGMGPSNLTNAVRVVFQ